MRRSVVGVGTHLRSEWGHCNYVHWEDLRLGTCWRKICLTGLLFLFLFFFFFFFFFKKIARYASLPLVGPFIFVFFLQENNKIRLTATGGAFFSFFLQKNLNVRSNHHKLFYRWIWDKFFFFFFDVRYGINFYLCLSSFFFCWEKYVFI